MRTLVIAASKHGSTNEIASTIADELRSFGLQVDRKEITDPVSVKEYDAVVLGSAVYIGKWMPEATRFVEQNLGALAERPVWLFSSGPLGEDNGKALDQRHVDRLMADTNARDHRLFAGALFADDLGLKERLAVKVVHAPYGDFRDWESIQAWARAIATSANVPQTTLAQG